MIYDQANAGQAKGRLINGYVLKIMGMLKDEKIKKASIPGSWSLLFFFVVPKAGIWKLMMISIAY